MDSIFIELFDHKSYKNKNIDLQSSGFNDRFQCFNHYINNGIKENRPSGFPNKDLTNKSIDYYSQNLDNSNKFYQSFNSSKYHNQHSDIKARRAFQNNKKLCWNHFVFYGWTENRLNCFNNPNLLQEYINLRKSLDYVIYFSLFDDIKYKNDNPKINTNSTKQNYWDHFQDKLWTLNRNKNYFKYEFLKDQYIEKRKVGKLVMLPDNNIENLSKSIMTLSSTLLPEDFNWVDYKNLNSDLQNLNEEELKNHYILNGNRKGRKYTFSSTYLIKKENNTDVFLNNKLWAHLHCYDIDKFDEIYGEYIENIMKYFSVVVTYSKGSNIPIYNFTILKIKNRGMDVGAKISCINFLNDRNIDYDYILMLHSKSNVIIRKQWITSYVNLNNIKIISKLLTLNKNIGLIGNNSRKFNMANDIDNLENLKYFLSEFSESEISLENIDITEGNMYILNSKVSNVFFKYLNKLYDKLYTPNTIQPCWLKTIVNKPDIFTKFNIPYCKKDEIEKYILENFIYNGITTKDIYPDAMLEHSIERIILFFSKNICKLDYLMIGDDILKDFNIKFDAIYFPQFHEIPENNKFWGKGFTEWTMLKPFPGIVKGKNYDMEIYKPHNDIGYYNLDLSHLKTQIQMASNYGINSFMIYHYWFENCHKVMNKPLEYFLLDKLNFNFYLCWANEPWARKWGGGQEKDDIMLDQKYNDLNEMIEYLIPFFKKPNYQKNEKGEVIYMIYNIEHITLDVFYKLQHIWDNRAKEDGIKISYVFYDNFPKNEEIIKKHNLKRFIFEPMNSNYTIIKPKLTRKEFKEKVSEYYYNSELKNSLPFDFDILWNHYDKFGYKEGGRIKINDWNCMNVDYLDIIQKYMNTEPIDIKNTIIGLPLNWNNIVRRKDSKFLYVSNFSKNNLDELISIIISKIMMKYTNIGNHGNYDNRILINAWNEWNEQAVLEPNNITGYSNLKTIQNYVKK